MNKNRINKKNCSKAPWNWFGLKANCKYFQVDAAYQKLLRSNIKVDPKIRLAWKILRDPYFSSAYKSFHSIKKIFEAGFFDDAADFEQTKKNETGNPKFKTPVDKIIKNLKKIEVQKSNKYAVLLSTGAFSPIHQGHIEMMNIAKRKLENDGYIVIGGYFSPSHDEYVSLKNPNKNTKLAKERINLCEKKLKNNNWLMVDGWESQGVDIPILYTEVLRRFEQYLNKRLRSIKPVKIFYVFGSDNADYCRTFIKLGQCICVERYGYSRKLQKAMKEKYVKNNKRIIFIYYEDWLLKLSSTAIRQNEYSRLNGG